MSALSEYWFPFYPARYKADTMHLTVTQDGIFRRLIDHYMETKIPLPDNDTALARAAGISPDEFAPHAAVIRAFFTLSTGKLLLKKCDGILADQAKRSDTYRINGKKGGRKKAKENNPEKAIANQKATTRHDITEQDKTGKKEPSLSQPIALKPPLIPPRSAKFNIEHLLGDEARAEAKTLCRSLNRDFDEICRVYNRGVHEGKRVAPDNPDTAFLGWIPAYTKNQKL